ncbi:MAG TPA: betaine--homocysteine S-methyltransferase [Afifellaceae bacterium]|nr:betaine--homocysteine S-methyltransferase [Afifellaceae bacterium]
MTDLRALLEDRRVLLADGATGTAYFDMGLTAGDPPELWNVDHRDRVRALHQGFVDVGSDIILTNTFGGNRDRLKLHKLQDRVFELNRRGAEIARQVADAADRPIVVAGSMGPLGELFEPLGALTDETATAAFTEQAKGLKAGGADVCWIETMSSAEELRAAAKGAIAAGMAYTATASFDTAGKTMMGLGPADLPSVFDGLAEPPVALGANCGVGASDLLVSLLAMSEAAPETIFIAKANAGVPQIRGEHVHYSGTPELMANYAQIAANAGARIIGGCCGTSTKHLAAMRAALDAYEPGERPDRTIIEAATGPLVNPVGDRAARTGRERRRRRRA